MKMIDIGNKAVTVREAVVEAEVSLKPDVIKKIKRKQIHKGYVLEAAKLAGILAAKKTPEIIPLCHPIPIEFTAIDFNIGKACVYIRVTVKGCAKTGVEMEAFTAASVSALTIYDMCKYLDRTITIKRIRLIRKSGGKSGTYIRKGTSKG